MIKTSILFLDIDGVIATDNCYSLDGPILSDLDLKMPYEWNKNCCAALNELLDITDCKIVLSSDWRKFYGFDEIIAMFQYYNINHKCLLGFTEQFEVIKMSESGSNIRTREIESWINRHKIEKFCVIDDMSLSVDNFVHITDTSKGLTREKIKEAINFLKKTE